MFLVDADSFGVESSVMRDAGLAGSPVMYGKARPFHFEAIGERRQENISRIRDRPRPRRLTHQMIETCHFIRNTRENREESSMDPSPIVVICVCTSQGAVSDRMLA